MSMAKKGVGVPMPAATLEEVWEQSIARDDYERENKEAESRLQYQIDYSQSLLRTLIIVNGGAIIAIFTFIGNDGRKFDQSYIYSAFASFSVGIVLTLLAYIAAFLSQLYFMNASLAAAWNAQAKSFGKSPQHDEKKSYKFGNVVLFVGFGFAVGSMVAFLLGAYFALRGVL